MEEESNEKREEKYLQNKRKKLQVMSLPLSKKENKKKKAISGSSRSSGFGLKEISSKVREIIKSVKNTSYKEISDQIVSEMTDRTPKDDKNIRRRIYDSLNVMKSMKLFRKERSTKKIMWNNSSEEANEYSYEDDNNLITLNQNIFQIKKQLDAQKETLAIMKKELESLTYLIERNKKLNLDENKKVYFPFIVIEFPENVSSDDQKIKVAMNENQSQAHFAFSRKPEDLAEVQWRFGRRKGCYLGRCFLRQDAPH